MLPRKIINFCCRRKICDNIVRSAFTRREIHVSSAVHSEDATKKKALVRPKDIREDRLRVEDKYTIMKTEQLFMDELKERNKETFYKAVDHYIESQSVYRRGHVEFINSAVKHMKEYGCHKDLQAYKKLLHAFPKGRMISETFWQSEFQHFPKQQNCAIDLMDHMNTWGVMPDEEFGKILIQIFGDKCHAWKKLARMMYWMPKFRHLNPYPLPFELPTDPIELAVLAMNRMCVDQWKQVTVWKTIDLKDAIEDTYIVDGSSPSQLEMLERHPVDKPLYIEGGYTTVLNDEEYLTYFVLRADSEPKTSPKENVDPDEDLFEFTTIFEDENPTQLIVKPSVHEQDDGLILGMCITGTATKSSLICWIRHLQQRTPRIEQVPIIFSMRTPETGLTKTDITTDSTQLQSINNLT